ncbi:MAG: DUF4157 domain-containing protein [Deltaproteobacteria bacterium]|nr:MAG: DUF4157 domain-containing protein [Deltaproteobacteria bacterium]
MKSRLSPTQTSPRPTSTSSPASEAVPETSNQSILAHASSIETTPETSFPHLDTLQEAFGDHDLSSIHCHIGGKAADVNEAFGSDAFAMGEHVAFSEQPTLEIAAEEAAHVIQQRNGKSPSSGVGHPGDALEQQAHDVASAASGQESVEGMLNTMGAAQGKASGDAIQFHGGTVTLEDDFEVRDGPQPVENGATRSTFLDVSQRVDAIVGAGGLDISPQTEEFRSSTGLFHRKADYCHRLVEYYNDRYRGNRFASHFAPGAETAIGWYEQSAIETQMIESKWAGMAGALEMSDAAWLRLVELCDAHGVSMTDMQGGRRGERALDTSAMEDRADALGALIEGSGIRTGLGGSSFQAASNGFFDKWMELSTAFRASSRSLVAARRTANQRKGDAPRAELERINNMIEVADTFGAAVSTIQGNMNSLQSQVAKWQSTVTPASVHVDDNGAISINHASVNGPDVQANLESYIGPAANAGGAIIRFIFDAEIRRAESALAAVSAHERAFGQVVGTNDAIATAQALVDAMRALKTQAGLMADEAENMRRAHLNYGAEIDQQLQNGGGLGEDQEFAIQFMAELMTIREASTYASSAHRMATEVGGDSRTMSERVRRFRDGRHVTTQLQRAARATNMADEERRYGGASSLASSYTRFMDRRTDHLEGLADHFVNAMGPGRASTDGRNTY